ncbi:hypothetical protein GCM10027456_30900 [Kineosporia babensis]
MLAAVVVLALVFTGQTLANRGATDRRRFDQLEAQFEEHREAFVAGRARMRQLVAANPRAEQIVWSRTQICVHRAPPPPDGPQPDPPARGEPCRPAALEQLPGIATVTYQAKDPGRTYFRFTAARYTLMYSAAGDSSGFARARGFRSSRDLEHGWTLLGPIAHPEQERSQWTQAVIQASASLSDKPGR